MCGICGAIDWSESPDASALVRRMTPTMRHRGPDDEGYLDSGELARVSLGMRRLSIIDVEGGHQPIFNGDGSVGVILNGEIYNFRELQQQLVDRGYSFRTRSDSEVVAQAYEEWGPECVERFQGMFAIAVYDRRRSSEFRVSSSEFEFNQDEGELFLARDRLGIKPLYYAAISKQQSAIGQTFMFASEVRTLLASGLVPRELSRDALESYLLFGSVSEPMTLVEGVYSLPPGHRVTISLSNPREAIKPEKYWDIASRASSPGRATTNGQAEKGSPALRVRELLEESVRKHLTADVPVGVFLSSGIDSTALAGLASREASGIHTFTVAFPEKEFSEAAIARRTAGTFGTTHQEVMLSGDEMLADLDKAVGALDQPSIDGINTYFVSWGAKQAGLKVALSGLGADEVFGGYSTFSRTAKFQRLASVGAAMPAGVRSVMAAAGRQILSGDAGTKVAGLLGGAESLPHPYYFGRALFPPDSLTGLMNGAKPRGGKALWWKWLEQSASSVVGLDSFAAVSCMEANSYLVNTLLRDTDSMSMAHSLEVRVPFLDHLLVEFVAQLPQVTKLRKGRPKALLVSALADILPDEVVKQTKRGFTFPWEEWLRGPLKGRLQDGLSQLSPALRGALNADSAQTVWRDYLNRKTSWSRPWSLYVLNEWTSKHLR